MLVRLRMIGGSIAALVLLALSVGVASPATAAGPLPLLTANGCGASVSSVTACPANVMVLAEAGILSMPSTAGGTVGAAAAPALTNTAGSAIGGALGLLGGIAATFGISQLFAGPSGTVQGAGVLQTDGVSGQKLTVNADLPGAPVSKDFTNNIGQQSCLVADATKCATVYATTMQSQSTTNDSPAFCAAAPFFPSNDPHVFFDNGTGGVTELGGLWRTATTANAALWNCPPPPAGSAAVTGIRFYWNGTDFTKFLKQWVVDWRNGVRVSPLAAVQNVQQMPGSMKQQLWCGDAAGNITNYVDAWAASLQKGQSVNLHNMTCPTGNTAVGSSIDFIPTDTSKATVPIQTRTPYTPGSNPAIDAAVARPQCANGSCVLELSKTNGESCGSIGQLCPDWAKDPNYTSNYQCKFGGELVALDFCSAYRSPIDGVQPNTKPDGSPYRVTDPVVKPGGQPVTDPNAQPNPDGTLPAPAPVDDPVHEDDPNGCRSASWVDQINPFNMFNTITCAMKAVFVPDPAKVQKSVDGIKDAWEDTPPVKIAGMVDSLKAAVPNGLSGCSGISFTFPAVLGVSAQSFTVLNACSEPVASVAAITRTIISIGLIFYGIMALTRMAGGVIEFGGVGKSEGS